MSILAKQEEGRISLSNDRVTLIYNLKEGRAAVESHNGFCLKEIHSSAHFSDGGILDSAQEQKKDRPAELKELQDEFGKGSVLTVRTAGEGGRELEQSFFLYEEQPWVMMEVCLRAQETVGSNEIRVYEAGEVTFSEGEDPRFLFTPFDNDDFVRYAALPLNEIRESYEVSAVYDAVTRNGMVTGSVSHDTWKTGIDTRKACAGRLEGLTVTAGVTSKLTRDTLPHGTVYGEKISSPRVFLGFYQDYRDGLEAYGRANGVLAPPLKWEKGIPVGWNSWAALATEINYDNYTGASDFVREHLEPGGYHVDGRVYINFDSFWNRLTEEELIAAAKHVHDNGQTPGIYTTPFAFWESSHMDEKVPGTDGRYCYRDILLKDENGNVLPPIDGGYCIDPTHPGNRMRLEEELGNFKRWGYEYIKMDFMAHGAVEGVHYDKEITTGIAAYNFGMRQINEILAKELEEQRMYISLSIAPVFPAQYAHGRRISCDVFGTVDWTEYMLNSLSYGWWLNGSVYRYNDPDHIVLYNSYNHREPIMFNEGLSRYFSAAIAGTMMLNSDDYRQEAARERAAAILPNREIMELARAGRSFRPVEGNTGDRACDCFVRPEEDGSLYLAVFNFSGTEEKHMLINLERLGLKENTVWQVRDLWSGEETKAAGGLAVKLEAAQPKIFRLRPFVGQLNRI